MICSHLCIATHICVKGVTSDPSHRAETHCLHWRVKKTQTELGHSKLIVCLTSNFFFQNPMSASEKTTQIG